MELDHRENQAAQVAVFFSGMHKVEDVLVDESLMSSIFPGTEHPALFAHLVERYLICRRWRRASPGGNTGVRRLGVEGRMPPILNTHVEQNYPVEHTSVMQVTSDRVHIYGLSNGDPSARLKSPRNLDSTICSLCNQPFTDCDNCMNMVHLAA